MSASGIMNENLKDLLDKYDKQNKQNLKDLFEEYDKKTKNRAKLAFNICWGSFCSIIFISSLFYSISMISFNIFNNRYGNICHVNDYYIMYASTNSVTGLSGEDCFNNKFLLEVNVTYVESDNEINDWAFVNCYNIKSNVDLIGDTMIDSDKQCRNINDVLQIVDYYDTTTIMLAVMYTLIPIMSMYYMLNGILDYYKSNSNSV